MICSTKKLQLRARARELVGGLSLVDGLGTRMIMVRLNSMSCYERLPVNHYGIKEPDRLDDDDLIAKPAESNLDLAIVPGLAFARDGRRLGHGKGYYDEFLSNWASETSKRLYTIGVALDKRIVDDVPTSDD